MVPISVEVPLLPLHFLGPPQALMQVIVMIKAVKARILFFIFMGFILL